MTVIPRHLALLLLAFLGCVALAGGRSAEAADDLERLTEAYEASVPSPTLRSEQGYAAQNEALEEIAGLRTPEARTTIRRLLLKYGTADYRQAAILLGALVRYGAPKDVDFAIDWVEGRKDPRMLDMLHQVLAEVSQPRALLHLREHALRGATPRVKVQILRALALRKDASVLPALLKMSREGDRRVRIEALEALGQLGDTKARAIVQVFLRDADLELRAAAARALGRLGDPAALPALERALTDDSPRVVESAAQALGAIDDPRAAPALIAGLERATDKNLRLVDAFTEALQSISGKAIHDDAELWRAWWAAVRDQKPFRKGTEKPGTKTVSGPRYYGFPVRSSRVVFVLDVSRSMGWNGRLNTAKKEMLQVLEHLPSTTHFNVIVFSQRAWTWKDRLHPATSGNLRRARAWIRAQRPLLGTNTHGALKTAFADPDADTIFLLSDGHPSEGRITDPQVILNVVREWNRLRGVRIHGIALLKGEPPAAFQSLENRDRSLWFMKRLCKENHGRFKEIR